MRILALIGDRPLPPVTGTAVRNLHLWSRMNRLDGVELKILALDVSGSPTSEPPCLPGVDTEFFRFGPRSFGTRAIGVLSRSWHEYPHSPDLDRRVDDLANTFQPDVIHAEELRMAAYLPVMRARSTPALSSVTFHNVESDLFARMVSPALPSPLKQLASRLQVRSLKHFESLRRRLRPASPGLFRSRPPALRLALPPGFLEHHPQRHRCRGHHPGPSEHQTLGPHARPLVVRPEHRRPTVVPQRGPATPRSRPQDRHRRLGSK